LHEVVQNAQWKVRVTQSRTMHTLTIHQDGVDGHISLTDDEPEVIRLLIDYMYLLDYGPVSNQEDPAYPGSDGSDTMSTISHEPGQYGHVYGTSAVSAFGGPQSPLPHLYRNRTESSLTVHALPSEYHGNFGRHDSRTNRSSRQSGPAPSPLASSEPDLVLHAR